MARTIETVYLPGDAPMSACTCSACDRVFTGLRAFDRHQDVDYSRTPAVICRDPADVGLIQGKDGRYGTTDGTARELRDGRLRAARHTRP